ncbi:DNA-binding protein [Novymonas esmeraldas]|uniref:DNA-binding protein n=1 Tax=Novymonas esmeraldas TaxID=1808958 RepID=A0AAW0F8A0_9TRYP
MTTSEQTQADELRRRLKRRRDEIHGHLDGLFYEDCRRVMECVVELDTGNLFLHNPAALPNYAQHVSRPMYSELIQRKLKRYEYKSAADFMADLRTVVNNCYLYNGIHAPASKLARAMEVLMEDRFVTELRIAPVPPAEVKRACTGMSSADSREILRIYALYEGLEVGAMTGNTNIQLRTAKSATLRRMLEYAQSSAEQRDKKAKGRRAATVSRASDRRRQESAVTHAAVVQQDADVHFHHDTEPRLERVPQNAPAATSMMEEVSPIRIEEGAEWFDDADSEELPPT